MSKFKTWTKIILAWIASAIVMLIVVAAGYSEWVQWLVYVIVGLALTKDTLS